MVTPIQVWTFDELTDEAKTRACQQWHLVAGGQVSMSDDAVADLLRSNEYEFTEEGTILDEAAKPAICVYFRKFPEGDVIALWNDTSASPGMMSSYMHVGQHSDADPSLVDELEKATTAEYAPLMNELGGRGYAVVPMQ